MKNFQETSYKVKNEWDILGIFIQKEKMCINFEQFEDFYKKKL